MRAISRASNCGCKTIIIVTVRPLPSPPPRLKNEDVLEGAGFIGHQNCFKNIKKE